MNRKLRKIANCLVVTIPKQICDLYKMKAGDEIEIETDGFAKLKLKDVNIEIKRR